MELSPAGKVQWQHSYVAGDKTYCNYLAETEDAVRKHCELSGVPAIQVTEVKSVIAPTTANG
ncbi:MAG: nickel-binding protein [Hyphomicrobiaceae bacterium]